MSALPTISFEDGLGALYTLSLQDVVDALALGVTAGGGNSGSGGGAAAGGATEATLVAVKNAILAQVDLAESLWTDNSGAYFIRREIVTEATGAVAVSYVDPTGAGATPGVGLRPFANEKTRTTVQKFYEVLTPAAGYAQTDLLAKLTILDTTTATPTVVVSAWLNLTQGTVISAPAPANIVMQDEFTTVAISAGEAHLGSVSSDSKRITTAPALTPQTYASGKCLGGVMTLPAALRLAGKATTLQSATLHSKVALSGAIDLVIFRDTPSDTTGLVDGATFAVAVADFDKVSKVLSFTSWNSLGTPSLARLDGIGSLLSAASGVDLKAILVARASVVIATSTDISVGLGVYQD